MSLPLGTKVQLSTGTLRPKRGKWVISAWDIENGQGRIDEVGADYFCVLIETRADGSPMASGYRRTQVIHRTDQRFTVTPL